MGITAHALILAGASIDHNPLLCVDRATPATLSTLRRLQIKLAVRVATPRRCVERLRARRHAFGACGDACLRYNQREGSTGGQPRTCWQRGKSGATPRN